MTSFVQSLCLSSSVFKLHFFFFSCLWSQKSSALVKGDPTINSVISSRLYSQNLLTAAIHESIFCKYKTQNLGQCSLYYLYLITLQWEIMTVCSLPLMANFKHFVACNHLSSASRQSPILLPQGKCSIFLILIQTVAIFHLNNQSLYETWVINKV